jgi:hypothetical protein
MTAHGGNPTEKEKSHGSQESQEIEQELEKVKEARSDQAIGTLSLA